jgi:hypothetical protein
LTSFGLAGLPIKIPPLKLLEHENMLLTCDPKKANQLLIECPRGTLLGKVRVPPGFVVMGDMIKTLKQNELMQCKKRVLGQNLQDGQMMMLTIRFLGEGEKVDDDKLPQKRRIPRQIAEYSKIRAD